MFNVPVLILLYNREDLSIKLYEILERIKPPILYINADGPKSNIPLDYERCEKSRNVFSFISWDCEVNYNFSTINKGCKRSVSEGIGWFFENVEYGIILEDDCIPNLSFFSYCDELLQRFRYDERVFHINGTNFLGANKSFVQESYSFTRFTSIWGWATWRRAWEKYDPDMKSFPKFNKTQFDGKSYSSYAQYHYLKSFEDVYLNNVNTWSTAWLFAIMLNNGVTLTPKFNLVTNIGTQNNPTHNFIEDRFRDNLKTFELDFPLIHPDFCINSYLDRINFKYYRGKSIRRIYFMLVDNSIIKIIEYLKKRFKSKKYF